MLPKKVQELDVPCPFWDKTWLGLYLCCAWSFQWSKRDISAPQVPSVTRAGLLQELSHHHPGTAPQPIPRAEEGTPSRCSDLGWERRC